jgi:hypothetical protein
MYAHMHMLHAYAHADVRACTMRIQIIHPHAHASTSIVTWIRRMQSHIDMHMHMHMHMRMHMRMHIHMRMHTYMVMNEMIDAVGWFLLWPKQKIKIKPQNKFHVIIKNGIKNKNNDGTKKNRNK